MKTYFFYECKRIIKSKKFIIALVFVLLVYVFTIVELKNEDQKRMMNDEIMDIVQQQTNGNIQKDENIDEVLSDLLIQKEMDFYLFKNDIGIYDEYGEIVQLTKSQKVINDFLDGEIEHIQTMIKNKKIDYEVLGEMNIKEFIFQTLYEYQRIPKMSDMDYSYQIAEVNKIAAAHGMKDVQLALEDYKEDIRNANAGFGYYENNFYTFQFILRYTDTLNRLEIRDLTPYSVNSSTVLYQLVSNSIQIAVPVLIMLMFFNLFDKDRKQGTLKSILIQPKRRTLSYDGKIISGLSSSLLMVFIPIILIAGILFVSDHGAYTSYPMIMRTRDTMSVNVVTNTSDLLEDLYYSGEIDSKTLHYGLSEYSPERYDYYNQKPALSSDLLPLWQFNLLLVAAVICYVAFTYMLFVFINTLINNRLIGCLVFMAIVVIGHVICPIGTLEKMNVINPFAYSNPIHNLQGTSSFGWPYIYIVLPIYTLLMYIAGKLVYRFKKFY